MRVLAGVCLLATASLSIAQEKPRIFITDSNSWETSGGFGTSRGTGGGGLTGGARPQTVEIIKTFTERCPNVTVTLDRDRADFVVMLDHEGGKDLVRRDNKIAVFKRNGDLLHTGSTRTLGNAVKDACATMKF